MKNEMRKALCDVMRVKAEHLRGIGITEKYCTQKDIDEIMTWEAEARRRKESARGFGEGRGHTRESER